MSSDKALPPADDWPLDSLEAVADIAYDAAIKMDGPHRALRLQILELEIERRSSLPEPWREYRRYHDAEIRAGERQMTHAISVLRARDHKRAFRVRDELPPEVLVQVVADCRPVSR